MLGEEVYDNEATQFDVDVAKIKINLIAGPTNSQKCNGKMTVELSRNRQADGRTLAEEIWAQNIPKQDANTKRQSRNSTLFSKDFDTETFILGKFFADKTNRRRLMLKRRNWLMLYLPNSRPTKCVMNLKKIQRIHR